jgi:hypothetical protein
MLPGGWEDGFAFTPEEGLAALPRVFALAREADLYVHLTVLNNTRELPTADLGDVVTRAGQACAADAACALLEVANEPYHRVQRGDVGRATALRAWAHAVPEAVPVALGASGSDESAEMAGGTVVTAHLARGGEPWVMVSRTRLLSGLASTLGKPVLSTEPDGFGEVSCVPRRVGCYRRQTDASLALGFGILSRLFGVGTTFHFEDGLRARRPGPVQQAAAEAFIAGTRLVSDERRFVVDSANAALFPIVRYRATRGDVPTADAAVRAYAGTDGDEGLAVLLGVRGDPQVGLAPGWRVAGVLADRPGIRVLALTRR